MLKSSYYNHYAAAGDSDRSIVFNRVFEVNRARAVSTRPIGDTV
jgi:hypothetical protein